ncbi:transposase [Weissella cibaria]|uniref:transposase n=1 Tax=Weissella cibaria TaxID=137591 RepID=UPI00216AC767|nr:transposase [Weissella cibaria]
MDTFGNRNSHSKTDTDATFMRVKEDPMMNGQLKPAYNVQSAVSNQMVIGYVVFQNPTDARTLIPLVKKMNNAGTLGSVVVADMGYVSEANYRFFEDEMPEVTALIPYNTMLREASRKWRSDDSRVMNWSDDEKADEYTDNDGVVFKWRNYSHRTDKNGKARDFQVYRAEEKDENNQDIPAVYTKGGNVRQININPSWGYQKARMRESLSDEINASIYARRKIDNEPVFGRMKAILAWADSWFAVCER